MALALLLPFVSACASHAAAPGAPSASSNPIGAVSVEAPAEVALEIACTPAGPETCFNAVDDNCNGAIDEGCGVHTGVVQFAIAWELEAADVDLDVVDPKGETTRINDITQVGLAKDRACPSDSRPCQGQNTENVYLVEGEVPRGTYRVSIRARDLGSAAEPLRVRFSARVGQRTWSAVLLFRVANERKVLSFAL